MAKEKRTNPFVWGGFILIAVGLVGVGGVGLTGNVRNIGTVGDKVITAQEYQGAISQAMQQWRGMLGNTMTFAQFQQFGGQNMALEQLVQDRALENEASRIGLSVGDANVARQIAQFPVFQDLAGQFSVVNYRAALRNAGLTEGMFETSQRDALSSNVLGSAVSAGVQMPALYAETLARHRAERRTVTWATVSAANITETFGAPTEEQLQAYHDAHPEVFTQPEVRRVTFAALTPEMAAESVDISHADLQALYQQRESTYVLPERRIVDRLMFNSDADAQAALERIQSGAATFEDIVTEMGFTLAEIDQGEMTQDALGDAGAAVFAANVGDVVGPLPTRFGAALFRVNVDFPAETTPFEDVRDELRGELASAQAGRIIAQERNGLTDLIAGGATIEDIANLSQLQLQTMDWQEGSTEGFASYEPFRAAVAAAQVGDFPTVTALPDGGIFVLRLDEIIPPHVQSVDDMRAYAEVMWRFQQTKDAVAAEATRLADALRAGSDFADLGLDPVTEPPLTRTDVVPGTPPTTMTTAFTLGRGDITTLDNEGTFVILRLDAIAAADEADPAYVADRDNLVQTLNNTLMGDVMQSYGGTVRENTPVRLNETAISAVNTGF
ncbi:peptidyl-prolyl cis-trans isomerase D [Ketogulonicigenium robustum]|uniref:Parvulin-like PPIase n=1 Tax=Ketogulonicigenium robustum TaxID=92947 RepID=A0A1W6NYH0_9RHOB|nr:peptidylprolyl isomerase [Ketogulonicigenium robustum]ARO14221.1 peptidyl-prolyl cis-trans isomerase D [Ketogulonicigenium robustum]